MMLLAKHRARSGSRWRWLTGAAVLPLIAAGLAGVAWAPGASAVTSHCLIINSATNTSYTSLQAAQDAASAGATLWVRGTCDGTTTISKDLTITGQQPNGFTTPTLDVSSKGRVLAIDAGVTVTVNTLTVTGGFGVIEGGGILNEGTLTLDSATVSGNVAGHDGGGIYNDGGELTMTGSTTVNSNRVLQFGGGIYTIGGTVTMTGSATVSRNFAFSRGGGIYNEGSALTGCVAGVNVLNNTPDDISFS